MNLTEEQRQLLDGAVEEALNTNVAIIPTNSEEYLINQNNLRFSGANWYEDIKKRKITIIGLGGIGSFTAFNISRLNPDMIYLYDMDRVDETNMSGQFYSKNQINSLKTSATCNNILSFSDYAKLYTYAEFVNGASISEITIGCLDNMKTRKKVFDTWKSYITTSKNNKKELLFIDGRLSLEELQVYCFTGEDDFLIKKYEKEALFSEEEAEETVCSRKQTTFCATMISSIITNLIINHTVNLSNNIIGRNLPFYTYYNAETMLFKTELT